MRLNSEKDRESLIAFLSIETQTDMENMDNLRTLVGTMRTKGLERTLGATIKRLDGLVTKNLKKIEEVRTALVSSISEPMIHLHKYGHDYTIFKEAV